jgi:hypothetical protein
MQLLASIVGRRGVSTIVQYRPEDVGSPAVAARLGEIRRIVGRWRANEERAAATLAINLTTTPLDQRELGRARLLELAGVGTERWGEPLRAPGADVVPARPREAFLQLIDRERTYFSNVPVETPVARVCRALVRLGVMDRISFLTASRSGGYNSNSDQPEQMAGREGRHER